MASKRLRILLIVLFIFIFGLISIPKFTFNLGDRTIYFDYVDRALNKFNVGIGNFRRSTGIYPSREVKAQLQFGEDSEVAINKDEILQEYLNVIHKRAETANLYDIEIKGEVSNGNYYLVLSYPDYYSDPIKYSKWLTSRGEITFQSASQENPQQIALKDYDIKGPLNLDYLDTVGTHLSFRFDPEKVDILNTAFSGNQQGRYFYMNVDNAPAYFIIEYDQYIDTNPEFVRALPTSIVELQNIKDRNDYVNITRGYFQTPPLDIDASVDENVREVSPVFKPETLRTIAFSFALALLFVSLVFLYKFGLRKFVYFCLMLLSFITLLTALLKIFSANLSIHLLIAYITSLILVISLVWYLFTQEEEIMKRDIVRIRDTSIFLFVVSAIITRVVVSMGILSDILGLVLVASIALFIVSVFIYKQIIDLYYSDLKFPKFSIKRK